MIELLYPVDAAPILGPDTAASEMLPIVDVMGMVQAQGSRDFCHEYPFKLHPVVHLQIVDRFSRLYLQHRSSEKDFYPGRWDVSVGGHVLYGEHFEEALYREASEELGLHDFNPLYIDNYIYSEGDQQELVNVYATIYGRELNPDNNEVTEGRFWTIEEIEASLGKDVFTPIFEMEYAKYKDTLLSLL